MKFFPFANSALFACLLITLLPTSTTAASEYVVATLSGDQEVPAVNSTASGTITFVYSEVTDSILWSMEIANPDGLGIYGAPGAHIHCGAAGFNGGVLVSLVAGGTTDDSESIGATGEIVQADILETVNACVQTISGLWFVMVNGGLVYVNVHSEQNPPGEIRADLPGMVEMPEIVQASLSGDQEVPPVNSTATGTVSFVYNEPAETILWALTIDNPDGLGIFGMPGAHIHCGGSSTNGMVQVVLVGQSMTTNMTEIGVTGSITQSSILPGGCVETLANLWIGMNNRDFTYINVHSIENPPGEIRSQLGDNNALTEAPTMMPVPTPSPVETPAPVGAPTPAPVGTPTPAPAADPTEAPAPTSPAPVSPPTTPAPVSPPPPTPAPVETETPTEGETEDPDPSAANVVFAAKTSLLWTTATIIASGVMVLLA